MKIVSLFESIQGEGINIGVPSIFIRIKTKNCFFDKGNLTCPWCDTIHKPYYVKKVKDENVYEVLRKIDNFNINNISHIVITGGEPFMDDDLGELVLILKERGYHIEIETNGSVFTERYKEKYKKVTDILSSDDYISISPKIFVKGLFDVDKLLKIPYYVRATITLNFVIDKQEDLDYFETLRDNLINVYTPYHIYLTPTGKHISNKILEYCKQYNIRFGIRGHILLWGNPDYDI